MKVLLIVLMLLNITYAKSLFSNKEQAQSSEYIGNLKDLLIATQRTRGTTNSYLHGNKSILLVIYSNRNDMQSAIVNMQASPLATDNVINIKSANISDSLMKINTKAFKQDPSDVFQNYTAQISKILILAQTLSKKVSKDLSKFGKDSTELMMYEMLPLTEYVGQLRGYGSGVAAKGKIDDTDIEQLSVLASRVQSLNSKLQKQVRILEEKYPSKIPMTIKMSMKKINNGVKNYIALTSKKLLGKYVDIDAEVVDGDTTSTIKLEFSGLFGGLMFHF